MFKTRSLGGYNMIRVNIRFNVLNPLEGDNIDDRTVWATDAIYLFQNKYRGIEGDKIYVNGIDDLMPKIRDLLEKNDIKRLDEVSLLQGDVDLVNSVL
jgi:hypothetical protein